MIEGGNDRIVALERRVNELEHAMDTALRLHTSSGVAFDQCLADCWQHRDAPPDARVVWFTGDEPHGREDIAWCPDCGTGLIRTQAVKPNHCPQCGYSWPDLPPLCPDCGVPQWTTGHYCVAKPDAALAAQEGRGS
jgi:hypothetical protein